MSKYKRAPLPEWLDPERDMKHADYSLKRSYDYWSAVYWATPPWISEAQIRNIHEIYSSCRKGQHVDHIVPLRHPLVCGLNVPWNMQVLAARDNLSKSNSDWPDSPWDDGSEQERLFKCSKQFGLAI